jgi:uncharacterized protein with HEPN domain
MNQLELLERKSRLWHIEQAANAILTYTAGKSRSDYDDDEMLRVACERQLIIIGEALRKALDIDKQLAGPITDANQIISFRNQLVHNYPDLDHGRIWRIIQTDLPVLLTEVRAVLATPPEPE